jgi:hypothetical protein
MLRRNYLLKHVTEGKIEGRIEERVREEEGVSRYFMILRKQVGAGIEIGSTTSHAVQNSPVAR